MTISPLPDDWTLPAITPFNRAWFESGTVAIQTCEQCGARQHPPEEVCHRCGAMTFGTVELAPTGTVHTFTVVHYPVNRALAGSVPYVVAVVALDDDPEIRVLANLLDVPPEAVAIGMPVRAVWHERSDDQGTVQLLQWTPA
jgi:uncharacterized OB-fold protein